MERPPACTEAENTFREVVDDMLDVRLALESDLPGILTIYNHAIATTTAVFDHRPHTLAMRHEWFDAKRVAQLPVFVAAEAGDILGFATYGPFRAWPGYKYTVEHSVYVAEHAWRRGIGRSLMHALLTDVRGRRYHAVIAGIEAENAPSLRLHESLGFVEVAHFREVGFKFGRWLDLKFLELLLPAPADPSL
jgi:phosphinothricin acetyltransferase